MESRRDPQVSLEPATADDEEAGVRRFSCQSGDGWHAAGVVAVGHTTPAVRSIEVRAADPTGDVTASLFRRVSIGLIVAEIQKALEVDDARKLGAESLSEVPLYVAGDQPAEAAAIELPLPDGYVRMTDALLRRVAEEYLLATAPGQPPRALDRLAATFGRPQETVRTWVARARKEGWLGQGVRGRAGAGPGPRLLGYKASEEATYRAQAAQSQSLTVERTWVKPDPDGKGGTVMHDSIPAVGGIERTEIERVADWRKYVDGRQAEADSSSD
ncbi:hypothetical protein [Streptomyces sp. NPDC049744]|uniref:hypothetical protein n=1 Tax=Streptomyces sp. NPDC049744 TaxID=3154359 RepID=UPI0034363165